MAAIGHTAGQLGHRLRRRLRLDGLMLAAEKGSRRIRHGEPRVFYRYRHAVKPAVHPAFRINYTHPPLRYSTMEQAQLYHWWHSPDVVDRKPFVLEPIDHVFSPSRLPDPIDGLQARERVKALYDDERCRRLLLSSSGQLEIFRHYFPDLEPKYTVLRPGVLPGVRASRNTGHDPTFLCVASSFELKAVDLVVQAWRATETGSARLVLVCPALPADLQPAEGEARFRYICTNRPLSERKLARLYASADVALVSTYVDAFNAYLEALAHGLPMITMHCQHAADFTAEGAGIVCDVPLKFYDPAGYGIRWRTWEDFFSLVADAKREGGYEPTVEQLSRAVKELIEPDRRREMADRSARLAATRYHIDTRNRELLEIYRAAL